MRTAGCEFRGQRYDCIAIILQKATESRVGALASITIRNLDEHVKNGLRVRAAMHGRSMEEEVRRILRAVVKADAAPEDLVTSIRARVEPLGGVELTLPSREPMRAPPQFG